MSTNLNPDTDVIKWNRLNTLLAFRKKYKNKCLNKAIFFHHFLFFDSNLALVNEINFLRYEQKNYYYEKSLDVDVYLQNTHIGWVKNYEHQRLAFFIRLPDDKYLCLHVVQWPYLLYGRLQNNYDTFVTEEILNMLTWTKEQKIVTRSQRTLNINETYIKFLINIYQSNKLLKQLS